MHGTKLCVMFVSCEDVNNTTHGDAVSPVLFPGVKLTFFKF